MTPGRPTGALLELHGMIGPADQQCGSIALHEMALQAEIRIAHRKQFGIDGSMRLVARAAAFSHGFVLEHVGPPLSRMAFQAGRILREQGGASAPSG